MSILMSHIMVTKNPQNVHKKCFWTILVTFIFYVQNWRQYVWTSLCEFIFFVNLLHSLCVWLFDIWHLFDILTSFWHLWTWTTSAHHRAIFCFCFCEYLLLLPKEQRVLQYITSYKEMVSHFARCWLNLFLFFVIHSSICICSRIKALKRT